MDRDSLAGLWFYGQKYFPRPETWPETDNGKMADKVKEWLDSYFDGRKPKVSLKLKPQGTAFQEEVWAELTKIPYGQTRTYGQIAQNLVRNKSAGARAVGGAVGHNPISILIPCHRVVGADGSLTGYAGGLDRKKALLSLEGSVWGCT
jgi:methylated-DNA-[protein]-cysteine S-methyltransferase